MLLDTEESGYPASNAYGIAHVPSLFLVERDGTIAWSLEGFNKREFLTMAAQAGVNPFLPGRKCAGVEGGLRVEELSSRREHRDKRRTSHGEYIRRDTGFGGRNR